MEMTLAVIIPNYNNSEFLGQCIESVMSQSYQPDEVIVFDDHSTDNSREILLEYRKKYAALQCIFSEVNVGVARARHMAILASKSLYITVLDSDDYYLTTDKLLSEMNTIERLSCHDRYVCSFSQVVRVNQKGELIDQTKIKNLESLSRFRTVTRMYRTNVPRDFCFSKEVYLLSGGYAFDCNLFEDWDLDLRLLKYADFVFSQNLGTAYRQKNYGLSKVSFETQYHAKKNIYKKNKEYAKYSWIETMVFYSILYVSYFIHRISHYTRK